MARGWAELGSNERGGIRITQTGRDALGIMKIAVLRDFQHHHPHDTDIREQERTSMNDETTGQGAKLDACVSEIVAAYVSNNRVPRTELPALIELVAWSVMALTTGRPSTGVVTIKKPIKAEIERSVGRDGIVSFIDGKTYRTLRRHLGRYGHTPQSYRLRYGLPVDYPMVAASFSERRIELSKQNSAKQRQLAVARKLH